MGLKNSRPLPMALAELEMAPFFKRRFRTWHLDHVALVVERYRALTMRHCIDAIQLRAILGIKEQSLIEMVMRLFMPKTPTRVHHMMDAMEIVLALILVCQAPSMRHRFEAIFDVIDLNRLGVITPSDVVVLFGAFARTVMKLFCYTVEPDQRAAMVYIQKILEKGFANSGSIEKTALCKLMLTDRYAVHYAKQCTGEAKHKLFFLLEKDTEFLGAIEFHTEEQMKTTSLKTIRELVNAHVYKAPKDFTFLCQGREVKRVWEADRKGWSIVPFAIRGSPGLRVFTQARNSHTECPRRANTFEFRYMGNSIARYKKRVGEINPVYKHRGFKVASINRGKPLTSFVRWQVAENWSGEWVYGQRETAAPSKTLLQKRLRNSTRSETERVSVKNHQGYLVSPSEHEQDELTAVDHESRPPTSSTTIQATRLSSIHKPEVLKQHRLMSEIQEKKVKRRARILAMEALQQLDGVGEDPVDDKENESRPANRTTPHNASREVEKKKRTTILIHVDDDTYHPSRLLQPAPHETNQCPATANATSSAPVRVRVSVLEQKLELQPSSKLSNGSIRLGPFLSSSNIVLKEDEVEVYPVIVIRPQGESLEFPAVEGNQDTVDEEHPAEKFPSRQPLRADSAYLSEYEFEVSACESNFEHIYHHVHGTSTDLITLNRQDIVGRTLLHDAAEYGHSNLLELLLKERVLRNVGDIKGDTPLHHAARHARLKEVSALLREGAAPWQLNHEGKSALFCALEAAAKNMRQSALSHKRPPTHWNASAGTVLRDVQQKNFIATNERYSRMRQVIDLLWDRYPVAMLVQLDSYDRASCLSLEQRVYGDLFQACRDGNLLRVQRLIDLDKRATAQYINEQLHMLGRTGLHEATEQGHTTIVDLLLKLGADGYIDDQRQQLPLHIAAEKGYECIAKCLIHKFPGSLQAQDCVGKTPLHLAAERNHTQIAMALIAPIMEMQDCDRIVNTQDMHGYTALHYACAQANLAVCKALVESGADVNVSCCESPIPTGRKHLLGVFDKQVKRLTGARVSFRRSETDRGKLRFELDSPVETLLRSSKGRSHGYQERLEILHLLVSAAVASSRGHPKRTKTHPPPLYHLATEIAATNMALAIDVCKVLSSLKYEVNLLHPVTSESALLQECKRVCQAKIHCVDNDDAPELALLRTLIQIGANVDLPSERNGETPLACAAWYGHLAMLDLLLDAGAQCDYFPKQSFSPLQFAALGNHLVCSKLLLSRQADINIHVQTPKHDEGPLFFAIRSKSEAMVDLILSRGADPCALCTLQCRVTTAFGIELLVENEEKRARAVSIEAMPAFGPGKELIDDGAVVIASPLTFTLLIARSLSPFASQSEHGGAARAQKRHEWEALNGIAMMVARQAIALKTPSGSAGSSLVTRNDVYLACLLGYWELAELLLAQQVVLPNAPTSNKMNALHLAAAAGQSRVVAALVAAGMNVNCRLYRHGPPRGALFFALTHGHVETAARLLVFGSVPFDVLPYSTRKNRVRLRVHESMPKTFKDTYFSSDKSSRPTESPLRGEYHPERVAINFVRHLEVSINAKLPLLHYAAGMGYTSLVKLLVEAGMSISTLRDVEASARVFSIWRREWYAETAIHVAVLCGHLDVVRYFASLVQFNLPRYFSRYDNKPKCLLVTACATKRVDLLSYLLSSGAADDDGGGYNALDTGDEIQSALNCCASGHFVDGVITLLKANARPDFFTLATAVEGITFVNKKRLPGDPEANMPSRMVETFPRRHFAARPRRDKRRILARTQELLLSISPFARHADQFFNVHSFDHVLTTFIFCSQYGLWTVLNDVFLANEKFFAEPLNPWKPIVVRAASCCMVMHRAAMADQVHVLRFFVRLGVQADLRLSEIPALPCPIRYAASHEALQAFLFLALQTEDLGDALDITRYLPPQIHYRSITSSTSVFTPSSTCKWQNLSPMSCCDIPQSRQAANFIQALIHLWVWEMKKTQGNALFHLACARGHPVLVRLLVEAGADLEAENDASETSLMVAAQRQDAFGVAIVRCLTATMPRRLLGAEEAARIVLMSRALVACFAQKPPCNLKTAEILLGAGAEANFVDENSHPPGQSAMRHALQHVHFAGVQLLVNHGATFSLPLTETFVSQFHVVGDSFKSHWRRFSSYLKSRGQRLVDVEGVMLVLLETKHASSCVNENLVHQLLIAAAAIAATIARGSGYEKKFWSICTRILHDHAEDLSSRKTVWGQKSALHYAVQCLEVGIVEQLVVICWFDIDAEDERKQTPLHLVAMNGDTGICHLLLSKLGDKTRIDCVDAKGRTPLHLAVLYGHEHVVAQLLAAGASLRVRCARGYNAHLYAATLNHVAILMALFNKDSSRDLLYSASREFALFLAARSAAFGVVRWIVSVFQGIDQEPTTVSLLSTACGQHQRTLLQYAAIFGDETLVKDILATPASRDGAILNAKDAAGYTALLYAFAFGRLAVATLLVEAGADADVAVDHSDETKTHPYACQFTIASLGEWFALPGWFSFVATRMPSHSKRQLTTALFQQEQYLFASGYHRRTIRAPIKNAGKFARQLPATERNAVVRTTIRSWKCPQSSLLEYACEVGDANIIELLTKLQLPGLTRPPTSFALLRRAFLEAVQWNRLEIVDVLLSPRAACLTQSGSAQTSDIQFTDFLEVAIYHAISRGLEDMVIRLLSQWHGIKENGRSGADANAFAFQFAPAFQVACIRRLTRVVDYMITRGGEQIVSFHWHDGPSLVYAFAFGHTELAKVLLAHGAHISTIDTYVAPSLKKWIEYGCPTDVQVQWYELSAARAAVRKAPARFVGPLEEYEPTTDRLDAEMMAALFLPVELDAGEEDKESDEATASSGVAD